MNDPRIANLPRWAQDYIKRLETLDAPRIEEIAQLRRKIAHLESANRSRMEQIEAMVAMFQCAAKGGNEVAQAVQRIVEDFLISDGE